MEKRPAHQIVFIHRRKGERVEAQCVWQALQEGEGGVGEPQEKPVRSKQSPPPKTTIIYLYTGTHAPQKTYKKDALLSSFSFSEARQVERGERGEGCIRG